MVTTLNQQQSNSFFTNLVDYLINWFTTYLLSCQTNQLMKFANGIESVSSIYIEQIAEWLGRDPNERLQLSYKTLILSISRISSIEFRSLIEYSRRLMIENRVDHLANAHNSTHNHDRF